MWPIAHEGSSDGAHGQLGTWGNSIKGVWGTGDIGHMGTGGTGGMGYGPHGQWVQGYGPHGQWEHMRQLGTVYGLQWVSATLAMGQ